MTEESGGKGVATVYVHGWKAFDVTGLVGWTIATSTARSRIVEVPRWSEAAIELFEWNAGSGNAAIAAEVSKWLMVGGTAKLKVLGAAMLGGAVVSDFKMAVKNTGQAGQQLNARLAALAREYRAVDLVAHSLGCRVVHNALSSMSPQTHNVRDVILLGGAMPARRSWWAASSSIAGSICNFGSRHDNAQHLYHIWLGGKWGRSIGRPNQKGGPGSGIHSRLQAVRNYDATKLIGPPHAHSKFLSELPALMAMTDRREAAATAQDWRDEFSWAPTPKFKQQKWRHGIQAEIVQRALSQPLDGGPPMLSTSDIDGSYGEKTKRAVRAFQERNGLSTDGLVGSETWKTLVGVEAAWPK